MTSGRPITDDDLQAYIDNALDAARRGEVEAHLEAHPDLALRVGTDIRHRDALRAALMPVVEEPVPDRLDIARLARTDRRRGWWMAAAATALFLTGGGAGWTLRSGMTPAPAGIAALSQEAADSYAVYAPDAARPVEIASDRSDQLAAWTAQRLQHAVPVPNLTDAGYRLVGGRLVATPHGPAMLYMYDNGRGTRLVMLTRRMKIDRDAAMSERRSGLLGTVSWARDGLGFSLAGPLAPDLLHPIADMARQQMRI